MSNVSRETEQRLQHYAALIQKWNPRINLVAKSTIGEIARRHVQDSQQIATLAQPKAGKWVDLGSGGGLPGIVAAIQCADLPVEFQLVESDRRKAAFLRTCVRELGLSRVTIEAARIESLIPTAADIVSARALAPLPLLMSYVHRHLKPGGTAWLMKGANWPDELQQARSIWRFDHIAHPSETLENAAILQITGLSHA